MTDPRLHQINVDTEQALVADRAEFLGPKLVALGDGERAQRPLAVTVRVASAADMLAVERLAQLDSAVAPRAPLLVAELGRTGIVAALSIRDGEVIADPFVPTAELVALLRLRARQLRSSDREARRRLQPAPLAWLRRLRRASARLSGV
jgi:hypothetical protein